jgi:hypothetical protein
MPQHDFVSDCMFNIHTVALFQAHVNNDILFGDWTVEELSLRLHYLFVALLGNMCKVLLRR